MKCPECKMEYIEDIPEDKEQHRIYHDQIVNGVPAPQLNSDEIIWQVAQNRIIVVTAYSPMDQKILASTVSRVANQEMHYDGGIYSEYERPDKRNIHLFLYCSGERAIGLSILEKRLNIVRYSWDEYDNGVQKKMEEKEPIWSLGFTWVHKKYRHRGIAKIVLIRAIDYLRVRINEIGLYTPLSKDGENFAKSIFPNNFLIAK